MRSQPGIYTKEYLFHVVKGACLLASGGGGTYSSAQNLLKYYTKGEYYGDKNEPCFEVVSKENAIARGGDAVVVAYIGAPQAISALQYPQAAVASVQKIIEQTKRDIRYVIPVEIGPLSSIVPCLVASKCGLKVIDADGAGRAVPELTMVTYAAHEVSVNPTILANSNNIFVSLAITDSNGKSCSRQTQENTAAVIEHLARPIIGINEFNQSAGIAIWIMDSEQIEKAVEIEATLTLAHTVGKDLTVPGADSLYIQKKLNEYLGGTREHQKVFTLFEGFFQTSGTATSTQGGFDHGTVAIRNDKADQVTVIFQNESLIVWDSSRDTPCAMAPDSICYLVDDEQKVYSNGDVIKDGKLVENLVGKKVTLIGIVAHEALRSNEQKLLSSDFFHSEMEKGSLMKSFKKVLADIGYSGIYVPLEEIASRVEKDAVEVY